LSAEADVKTNVRFHDVLRVAGLFSQNDIEPIRRLQMPSQVQKTPSAQLGFLTEKGLLDKRTFSSLALLLLNLERLG